MEKRKVRTLDEVTQIVEHLGYILLDCYLKNNRKWVIIQDKFGYKYNVVFSSLLKNSIPEFVFFTNQFSLKNISLWLKNNKKLIALTEGNAYISAKAKLIFKCLKCGEIFYARWDTIKIGKGCPYCAGQQVSDKNRLSIVRPNLIKDWHPYKNGNLQPRDVSFGSKTRVWWKCSKCGWEWETQILLRGSCGNGCPACSRQVVTNKNRLSVLFPNIALEWNIKRNGKLTPHDIACKSNKKYWWKCLICDCEWLASPNNRTKVGYPGCPFCAGKTVTDKNRLSLVCPDLINEWDFSKNKDLTPDDVSFGIARKVWWLCSCCGNSWLASIAKRSSGRGCPKCNKSWGEKRIAKFLDNINIIYIPQHQFKNCKNIFPLRFDFYFPELNTCLEYNGKQHYEEVNNDFFGTKTTLKDRQRLDRIKENYCKNNNIKLLIIPYWEFNNIESILENLMVEKNILK
jgi:hypothetical protein